MRNKFFQAQMNMVENEEIDKEVKLLIILELLYHEEISLVKAKELCTQIGLLSGHWGSVDGRATELFSKSLMDVEHSFRAIQEKYNKGKKEA